MTETDHLSSKIEEFGDSNGPTNIMAHVGPPAWDVLHYFAFMYPENPSPDEIHWSKMFVHSYPSLLPCPDCRGHFAKLLRDYPLTNRNRDEFSRWTVDAHNMVNARLGKPTVTYEEALTKYSPWYAECHDNPAPCPDSINNYRLFRIIVGMIILGIILAVVAFYIGRHTNNQSNRYVKYSLQRVK
jgi:hypothetical protein